MTTESKLCDWAEDEMEKKLEEKVKGMTEHERIVYLGRVADYILRLNGYHRTGEVFSDNKGIGRGEFIKVK